MPRYFVFYKPFRVLSQFTSDGERQCLRDFCKVPPDTYPVGRLDYDSEGLLLLTSDKPLTERLLNPRNRHEREYHVQVEGVPDEAALRQLRGGVIIEGNITLPAKAELLTADPGFPPRVPPIRVRKSIPDCWLKITVTEGRNRMGRKMTAAVGYPTLRLVRTRIVCLTLSALQPGGLRELTSAETAVLLRSLA